MIRTLGDSLLLGTISLQNKRAFGVEILYQIIHSPSFVFTGERKDVRVLTLDGSLLNDPLVGEAPPFHSISNTRAIPECGVSVAAEALDIVSSIS